MQRRFEHLPRIRIRVISSRERICCIARMTRRRQRRICFSEWTWPLCSEIGTKSNLIDLLLCISLFRLDLSLWKTMKSSSSLVVRHLLVSCLSAHICVSPVMTTTTTTTTRRKEKESTFWFNNKRYLRANWFAPWSQTSSNVHFYWVNTPPNYERFQCERNNLRWKCVPLMRMPFYSAYEHYFHALALLVLRNLFTRHTHTRTNAHIPCLMSITVDGFLSICLI